MIDMRLTTGQANLLMTTMRETIERQRAIAATRVWPECDVAEATAAQLEATVEVVRLAVHDRITARAVCIEEHATAGLDAAVEIDGFDRLTADQYRDEVTYLSDYQG